MPKGSVHFTIWKLGWIDQFILFIGLLFIQPFLAFGSIIGYFLSQFIDPDMDLVGISSAEGRMLRKIPLLGGLFVAYWTMYGAVFRGHHRSFWTHSYFFSTAIRFAYAFWWLLYVVKEWEFWRITTVTGIYFGMCLADALHILADRRIR